MNDYSQRTYELLRYIQQNPDCHFFDAVQTLPDYHTAKELILYLHRMDLLNYGISDRDTSAWRLHLTGHGYDLLFRMEEVTPLQRVATAAEAQATAAISQADYAKELAISAEKDSASAQATARSVREISISAQEQAAAAKAEAEAAHAQVSVLEAQVQALQSIKEQLEEEATARSHDDKKYFWIGAAISFGAAILVEHGPVILALLQRLVQ